MNRSELKNHPDYIAAKNKIVNYTRNFEFTINFSQIPVAKANALRILLRECCDEKILESTSFGVALTGDIVEETYKRL